MGEIVEPDSNAKVKANQLYQKYIDDDAEFVINISGKMRDRLSDSIGDLDALLANDSIDLDTLYTIFESSVQEMITLQTISFERFKQSKPFDAVKAILCTSRQGRDSIALLPV